MAFTLVRSIVPSLRIILITNDKNLANKSIICRTQAMHLNTLKANIISLLLQATSAAAVSTARCDLPAENVSRTTITPTKTTETATAAANMDIVLPAFQDARIALLMHKLVSSSNASSRFVLFYFRVTHVMCHVAASCQVTRRRRSTHVVRAQVVELLVRGRDETSLS